MQWQRWLPGRFRHSECSPHELTPSAHSSMSASNKRDGRLDGLVMKSGVRKPRIPRLWIQTASQVRTKAVIRPITAGDTSIVKQTGPGEIRRCVRKKKGPIHGNWGWAWGFPAAVSRKERTTANDRAASCLKTLKMLLTGELTKMRKGAKRNKELHLQGPNVILPHQMDRCWWMPTKSLQLS